MRNLKIRYTTTHNTTAVNPKFVALDPSSSNNSTVFICTDKELLSYNLSTDIVEILAEVSGVVSGEYLSLENEICVATDAGEVLLINPETKNSNEVTFCDGGIEKMVWSPDQEVVAFVTKTRNVVVMTCTFDPISELPLEQEQFGENAFITVGWGKKETQFHGSEGKTAAKQTTNFNTSQNITELPQEIDITWRADGGFFAVTFVGPHGRMFKVFDKEGALKYMSEKLNDLWPAIAWRPSGTWIAVPHKFPNKSTIALFEKNGLRHREIVLPFGFDDEPVVSLKWSTDSDILAVETVVEGKSNLYLYTIGNYHWYLKQTLCFDTVLASYVWDNRIGEEKTMYAMQANGTLAKYSWTFAINQYESSADSDDNKKSSLIGVIDGKRLLITDFCSGIIPPPMSSWQVECDSYINSCAFLTPCKCSCIALLVYNAQNQILIYALVQRTGVDRNQLLTTLPLDTSVAPLTHHNFIWSGSRFCYIQSIGHKSRLCSFKLPGNFPWVIAKVEKEEIEGVKTEIDETICYLEGVDALSTLAQTINGQIWRISFLLDHIDTIDKNYCNPGIRCDKIEYFKNGVISLDNNQCLRLDSKTLSTDVTSFHMTTNYLVFTQLSVMKFLRLSDEQIVSERKIERGAKIVTILPSDSMTILQLPRGNLEAIHPRVLCLESVGKMLDKSNYVAAMDVLRKQRINLNIICDHNMQQFLENLKSFSYAMKPQWLNLFLTELQNEDFTTTMYTSNYPDTVRKYPDGFCIENKVTYICAELCKLMESNDFHKFLLSIITAYVKIGNIEKALDIIWQEKNNERTVAADLEKKENCADDALKYLLYLVDVNHLYDVALGMYDFALVLMVAKKSQKDPREFLPFLNELKSLEENYRKFKIDFHLKRFDKALVNICRCGVERFEEALDLVKSQNLYKVALSAYQADKTCYTKIAHAYGDYLRENGKFENASIMYERANDRTQAVACARHILDWQRCLALTKQEGAYPQDIAISLVPLLIEHGRYEDAYELLRRYGNNFTEGIACLLKGNLHLRAIFEVRMENTELLESIIHPHLLSYKETLESNLSADLELFLKQKKRLLTIRENKLKEAAADDIDESIQIDESDLLSDTTSMHSSRYTSSSRGTGKTFRSSKNRRKHERKLLSLKEGNPFEDIALIDALHSHIMKVYALQLHIRDTCKALLEILEDDHARAIQSQYRALVILIRESLDEIWTPQIMTTAQYITGPNVDYAALQNEQRYAMINPLKRFKPQLTMLDWEHEILR